MRKATLVEPTDIETDSENEYIHIPYDRDSNIGEKPVAPNREDNASSPNLSEEETSEWEEEDVVPISQLQLRKEEAVGSEPELPLKLRLRGAQALRPQGDIVATPKH